jgi:hypothetical protein
MALLTPPPAAPQRGDRTTFASRVDAFITWLINFVSELVSLVANLNSLFAGGAYSIPFRFTTDTGHITQGSWLCLLSPTSITFDALDARYADTSAQLNNLLSGSTSAVKAQLRICAQADPSRWFLYNVVGYTQYGAYGGATVQIVASSGTFAEGESVIAFLQRTGDKGDKGDNGTSITPILWVRDEKPSGTTGGSPLAGANVRPLNSVFRNTIPGASLSGNRVTLPAGTYRFHGNAPAYGVSAHQAYLYSITAGNALVYGSSEYSNGSANTRSLFVGAEVVFSTSTTLELRQWCSTTSGTLGMPSSSGANEVYSELFFEKIA